MRSPATRPHRQQPAWVRVCLHSLLILGIFGMHQMMAGDAGGSAQHGDMQMASATVAAAPVAMVADDRGHADVMADCGGVAMLCAAILLGLGAFIAVRRLPSERVLWQLPPPFATWPGRRIPAYQGLTPLQRSSVIRC